MSSEGKVRFAADLLGVPQEDLVEFCALYQGDAREAAILTPQQAAAILVPLIFPKAGFLTHWIVRKFVHRLFTENRLFRKLFAKLGNDLSA